MDIPRASWPTGWHVDHVVETTSTNADLLVSAANGAADRSVLFADFQTAGRGRLDRRWDAPPGSGLLASMLFRNLPEHLHELTQRVALAAAAAVHEVADIEVALKWPNDLLVNGAKLAGVLAQSGGGQSLRPDYVVVGIGINVSWAPEGAAMVGQHVQVSSLLAALLEHYDRLPADVASLYRTSLATLGQQVRVQLGGTEIVGRAINVEADGRLVVIDECGATHRVDTGDVVHLR